MRLIPRPVGNVKADTPVNVSQSRLPCVMKERRAVHEATHGSAFSLFMLRSRSVSAVHPAMFRGVEIIWLLESESISKFLSLVIPLGISVTRLCEASKVLRAGRKISKSDMGPGSAVNRFCRTLSTLRLLISIMLCGSATMKLYSTLISSK